MPSQTNSSWPFGFFFVGHRASHSRARYHWELTFNMVCVRLACKLNSTISSSFRLGWLTYCPFIAFIELKLTKTPKHWRILVHAAAARPMLFFTLTPFFLFLVLLAVNSFNFTHRTILTSLISVIVFMGRKLLLFPLEKSRLNQKWSFHIYWKWTSYCHSNKTIIYS